MIEILIAAVLATSPVPAPTYPVCQPGQVPWEVGCVLPQAPGGVVGRQIVGPDGVAYVVVGMTAVGTPILATMPQPQELAHTGVPTGPYAAAAGALIAAGVGLLVGRRRSAR